MSITYLAGNAQGIRTHFWQVRDKTILTSNFLVYRSPDIRIFYESCIPLALTTLTHTRNLESSRTI